MFQLVLLNNMDLIKISNLIILHFQIKCKQLIPKVFKLLIFGVPSLLLMDMDTNNYKFEYLCNQLFAFDLKMNNNQIQTVDSEGFQTFDFWCPFSTVDGYGRHALTIYKGLQKSKV